MTEKQLHVLKFFAHWIVVIVSMVFTVMLFYQLSSTFIGKIATVSFGIALELLKIYTLTTLKDPKSFKYKLFKNIGYFLVYVALAVASGLATLGFARVEIQGQSFYAEAQNIQIVSAQQDVQRYTIQINDITNQMISLPSDWITARQRYLTTISELEILRAEAMSKVALAPQLEAVSTDVFTLLGELPFINMDGETLLFYIFLALVILLEIAIAITTEYTVKEDKVKKKEEKEEEVPGFFEIAKTQPLPTIKPDKKISGCETCGMYKHCQSPKIDPVGSGKILIVFQPPTRKEDHGKPFTEGYQRYLYSVLADLQIKKEDCTLTHAIQCYQGEKVSPKAIEGCHYRLRERIRKLKPKMVIVCDGTSMKTLYHSVNSGRFSFANYGKFTGSIIPDQELQTIVVPIESPYEAYDALAYRRKMIAERDPSVKFNDEMWKDRRLKNVDRFRIIDRLIRKQLKRGLGSRFTELKHTAPNVTEDLDTALEYLRLFLDKDFAFDIETTGLKPYSAGHKIWTWGFSDGTNTYAFPHFEDKKFLRVLKQVLTSDFKKIGWNIKFEHNWIRHFLGFEVTNWHWDGMIAAHILDNRAGITSLKFQTYSELGIAGYDDGIDQFLKSGEKNGNAINRIEMAPLGDLLLYNGLDALYTFKIYEKQFPRINRDSILSEGYELFHEGQLALSDLEYTGIGIDIVQVEKNILQVEKKMMTADHKIRSAPELAQWDKYETFNPNSGPDKIHMFYDICRYPVLKRTDKGEPSTDSDTLSEWAELYENKLAEAIVEGNSYKKVLDSLKNIKSEATVGADGEYEVHPFFNLNTVSSYRSSSDSPNAQNIPVHNEQAAQLVLGCYMPRKGKVIVGADYTSIESFVSACYHNDKTFVKYLMEEGTDAHADTAEEIFKCKIDEVDPDFFKTMRRVGKNVNFSVLYGISVFKLIQNTWNSMLSLEHKEFLKSKGIEEMSQWGEHMTQWYNDYWTVKYEDLGKWRNDIWENYIQTGEAVSYTGFKAVSKSTKNFIGNMPSQSAAFHMLLRGMVEMRKALTKHGISAKMILQIHDSIKVECEEKDIEIVKDLIEECFINLNKKRYLWMTMPLKMKGEVYRKNLSVEEEHFALGEMVA